jgi:hypothetical protein
MPFDILLERKLLEERTDDVLWEEIIGNKKKLPGFNGILKEWK